MIPDIAKNQQHSWRRREDSPATLGTTVVAPRFWAPALRGVGYCHHIAPGFESSAPGHSSNTDCHMAVRIAMAVYS